MRRRRTQMMAVPPSDIRARASSSSNRQRSESAIKNALARTLKAVERGTQVGLDKLTPRAPHGPQLQPLTPRYESDEHRVYANAIEVALTGSDSRDIHNIALTGAYGAGKSSVLREVVHRHSRAVQISLSTLGSTEDATLSKDKDAKEPRAETPTNRIQKEIVKQLLYQAGPAKLPGSRYRRLGRLRKWRTLAVSLAVGLGMALLLYVTPLMSSLTSLFTKHVASPLIPVAVAWAVATAVVYVLIAVFHNRISIDKLGAASATISLSRKSETFFDEYLDEIVYFFDVTKRDIVIFEDIDRFDEPYIFETLRALNTLLNAAKQLRGRNVRFIYAIKDSIFDALSQREAAEQIRDHEDADLDVATAEVARANRTKFFDLVVPIVPFVTHLNARDLMHDLMKGLEPEVDPAVMDLVAGELPDMRLIIEARNEYLIFSKVVLGGGLQLDPTSLFAMMLYKSTHLSDFEAIRKGESHLDELYDLRGDLITQNLATLNRRATTLRQQTTAQQRLHGRTTELGERLIQFTVRMGDWSGQPANGPRPRTPTIVFDGTTYSSDEILGPAFWRAFAANPGPVQATMLNTPYGPYTVTISPNDMQQFIVTSLPDPAWFQKTANEIDRELEQIRGDRTFLSHATMQDLFGTPRFTVDVDGAQVSFAQAARDLIPSKLARRLIEKGYIDADFTLYTSKYYGTRVSARASNFILHNIDRGVTDLNAPLDPYEVDSIIRERGDAVLSERAMLNVAIADRLIDRGGVKSQTFINRFALPGDDELGFLEVYLVDGEQRLEFVRRLAAVWEGTVPFVVERVDVVEGAALHLLDAALRGLEDDIESEVNEAVQLAISAHYVDLPSLTADEEGIPTEAIADLLERADVSISDVSALTASMRAAVVDRSLYPVTRDNLIAAVGSGDVALDQLRAANEAVYEHALAHSADYLNALRSDEPTVAEVEDFVLVVNDIAAKASDSIAAVIARAAAACQVPDLSAVSSDAWEALADGDRFPPTMTNVALYVETREAVDPSLGGLLDRAGTITTTDTDGQDERQTLALSVLGARTAIPSQATRVGLAKSLGLADYLPVSQITAEPGDLVALLIKANLIEDTAEAFGLTKGLDWATRERTIAASSEFASFILDAGITAGEVPRVLNSTLIEKNIRDDLARSSAQLVSTPDRAALSAVAHYAVANDLPVAVVEIIRMASARVEPRVILDLLDRYIESASLPELTQVLNAIGGDYTLMTERTRRPAKIVNTLAAVRLAGRLEQDGLVSSAPSTNGPDLLVYMHH